MNTTTLTSTPRRLILALVAAGAVASAPAFDDPDLLARLAAAMAW